MRDFREGDRVIMELAPTGWPRWDGLYDRGSSGLFARGEVTVARSSLFWVEFAPASDGADQADWAFHQPSVAGSIYRPGSGAPERVLGPCSCGAASTAQPYHYDWCDAMPD